MPRPDSEKILGDAELVTLVGEINLLWDEIEIYLWYVFDTLLHVDWRYSFSVFFSQQSHRARREMLEALASFALQTNPSRFKELSGLLGRVKSAARKRNDIAHGIWTEAQGVNGEITRTPIKRKYHEGTALSFSKKHLKQTRDQIARLEQDLFNFAYDSWYKSILARGGHFDSDGA